MASTRVCTVGHGRLAAEAFVTLVSEAGVDEVVDIRSFPGSRHNPHYGRAELERWLPAGGLGYRWIGDLGGRRRPVPRSRHLALTNESFRAYADHMETPAFSRGVGELMSVAAARPVAVMCSESVWWRCHRRLLADHLVLMEEAEVLHLMHDGRLTPHAPTRGARRGRGSVVYDVGVQPSLLGD